MDKTKHTAEPVTYGVYGLTEWDALIPVDRAVMRVCFRNGQPTGFDARAATFTTSNPKVQDLIENSRYFRTRRIQRISFNHR